MKIENQTSVSQLPVEISKLIQEVSERSKNLNNKLSDVHAEKIYDSYTKMDGFRRELYEIDLLSQNLMDAYRVYSAFAYQVMALQTEHSELLSEDEEFEGYRAEEVESEDS